MKVNPVEYDQATPQVKAIYNDVLTTMSRSELPNWVKYLGGNERILRGNWSKFRETIFEGQLPMLLKQIILFIISRKFGSEYCIVAHAHAALEIDKSLVYEDLLAISEEEGYEKLPSSYQQAIKVGVKCALEPKKVSNDDFNRLKAEHYTEEEILELISQADVGVMFNFVTINFEIPVDNEYKKHID